MTSAPGAVPVQGTILIVDDEPDIRETIRRIFLAYLPGAKAITAASGVQALEVLGREKVDLLVADYKMPEMDGLQLLTRARHSFPQVPRIMITAYPDAEIAVRAKLEGGVSYFLVKPLKREHLVDVAAKALRGESAAS